MKRKVESITVENPGMPQAKIASRNDVARLAGVSPSAVSQVLNNLPNTRISPVVREKILSAVRGLGYRPHPIAKALAAGRTSIIGVLIFHVGTPFGEYSSNILNASWLKFNENSYKMLIDCKKVEDVIAVQFREEGWCDGYIIIAPPLHLIGADAIPASQRACICIGSSPDGIETSYADMDNRHAGRMAVSYLIEKGHSKIAHISGPVSEISSARDRFTGYIEALRKHSLKFSENLVSEGNYMPASGRAAMAELLNRGDRFTAVFVANDGMARGAIDEARANGLRVPQDISIIGIDDSPSPYGEATDKLTTIRQPLAEIGAEAASILLKLLSENPKSWRPIVKLFPGKIIERATVAKI
jgi:LacI family transcriptional regulator